MAHLPPWRSRRIRVRCGRAFTTLAGRRRIIRARDGKVAGRCRWSNDHDAVQGLLRHPGVEPSAGDAEIKTAYRRLARKYHPDVSKEAGAEEKSKAVNEAYEALRATQKRAASDR